MSGQIYSHRFWDRFAVKWAPAAKNKKAIDAAGFPLMAQRG
ncbi:hypothetical protein THTE_2298 [Thermogutta terrifontis]|uniref:Uncharacterized protein n=1 Tax=Thermogutta terrifontis TaxID=1331910 RepID=A0A286RG12_9BACT|nr:hypothetical protein THTE_2298 [Thermogutta terrifontis]